jgi:endonuclease/exonuclease/phosphatase (EEP) superfamily protein YafD
MSGDPSKRISGNAQRSGSFLWGASWEHRKRLLRIEAWVLVVGAYVLVIFAYAWPADFRNQAATHVAVAWLAALVRTFMFHGGLLLAVVAITAAFARRWRLFAATMPLLLVTLGPSLLSYWSWTGDEIRGKTLTVMSVNLLMVNRDTAPIVEEIEAIRPDILLLQEYTVHWHQALQAKMGADYRHICHVTSEDSFGAAIYSRQAFVDEPECYISLGQASVPQMRAVIEIDGRKAAVYNIHLLPPWGMAYTIENRSQFADLLDVLAAEPLPIVMGGDFNFTENSLNAAALRHQGLVDAHSVGGWGRGGTWPVNSFFRWLPSVRLDHVYLGGGLTCSECRTGAGRGSDHRPVIARIGFGRQRDRGTKARGSGAGRASSDRRRHGRLRENARTGRGGSRSDADRAADALGRTLMLTPVRVGPMAAGQTSGRTPDSFLLQPCATWARSG